MAQCRGLANLAVMQRLTPRTLFSRYAVAWAYLACVIIVGLCYAALSGPDQAALVRWASTSGRIPLPGPGDIQAAIDRAGPL